MPSAEAVLGLAARVEAAAGGHDCREALRQLAEGIAAMSAGDARLVAVRRDPAVGAVAQRSGTRGARRCRRRSPRHPYALRRPLARRRRRSGRRGLHADAADRGRPRQRLDPRRPTDRVQIAYGVDSRVQSLARRRRRDRLAGFDGRSPGCRPPGSSVPTAPASRCTTRRPASTFDGVSSRDGTMNRNSGAESTIHALLTMIALDARPELAARASSVDERSPSARGCELGARRRPPSTPTARSSTPESWTGESSWSGERAHPRSADSTRPSTSERHDDPPLGRARRLVGVRVQASTSHAGRRGIAARSASSRSRPRPGHLADARCAAAALAAARRCSATAGRLSVDVLRRGAALDALLVRPFVSRLELTGEGGVTAAGALQQRNVAADLASVADGASQRHRRASTTRRAREVTQPTRCRGCAQRPGCRSGGLRRSCSGWMRSRLLPRRCAATGVWTRDARTAMSDFR